MIDLMWKFCIAANAFAAGLNIVVGHYWVAVFSAALAVYSVAMLRRSRRFEQRLDERYARLDLEREWERLIDRDDEERRWR